MLYVWVRVPISAKYIKSCEILGFGGLVKGEDGSIRTKSCENKKGSTNPFIVSSPLLESICSQPCANHALQCFLMLLCRFTKRAGESVGHC